MGERFELTNSGKIERSTLKTSQNLPLNCSDLLQTHEPCPNALWDQRKKVLILQGTDFHESSKISLGSTQSSQRNNDQNNNNEKNNQNNNNENNNLNLSDPTNDENNNKSNESENSLEHEKSKRKIRHTSCRVRASRETPVGSVPYPSFFPPLSPDSLFGGFEIQIEFQIPTNWDDSSYFKLGLQNTTNSVFKNFASSVEIVFRYQRLKFSPHELALSLEIYGIQKECLIIPKISSGRYQINLEYYSKLQSLELSCLYDSQKAVVRHQCDLTRICPPPKTLAMIFDAAFLSTESMKILMWRYFQNGVVPRISQEENLVRELSQYTENHFANSVSAVTQIIQYLQTLGYNEDPYCRRRVFELNGVLDKLMKHLQKKAPLLSEKTRETINLLQKQLRALLIDTPPPSTLFADFKSGTNLPLNPDITFCNSKTKETLQSEKVIFQIRAPFFFEKIKTATQYVIDVDQIAWDGFVEWVKFVGYESQSGNELNLSVVEICKIFQMSTKAGDFRSDLARAHQRGAYEKDVEFILEDETVVATSRAIMSIRSPFFRGLLSGRFAERNQKQIRLSTVTKAQFFLLEHYSFCDTLPKAFDPQEALETLLNCSYLLDERLRWMIENTLIQFIDNTNAVDLYLVAKEYALHLLSAFSLDYLRKNFAEMSKSDDIYSLGDEVLEYLYIETNPQNRIFLENERKIRELNKEAPKKASSVEVSHVSEDNATSSSKKKKKKPSKKSNNKNHHRW